MFTCCRLYLKTMTTGRPLKPCKQGWVRNPETNRCRKRQPDSSSVLLSQTAPTWNDVIKSWKSGKDLPDIKGSVFWETSVATAGGDSPFRQKTKSAARALPMTLPADPAVFAHHMKNKKTPVAFNSFGGTLLVIPPDTGKNFSHLATFYKHSSDAEKRALWKKVAVELQRKLKRGETVFVSTHGTGVSWLHVRLASRPMYYVTSVA
ncbi:unnamed protein product [Ectocarpus sp. 6 AP-2014]